MTPCKKCANGLPFSFRFCPSCGDPVRRKGLGTLVIVLTAIGLILTWVQTPKWAEREGLVEVVRPAPEVLMDKVAVLIEESDHNKQGLEQAISLLDRLLSDFPKHGYSLRLKATLHRDLHQTDAALASYDRYLKLVPDDARSRLSMGQLYLELGMEQEAIAVLDEILAKNPNYADAVRYLAIALKDRDPERVPFLKRRATELAGNRPPTQYLPRLPDGSR